MPTEPQQLHTAIRALEAQRAVLGDATVDIAVAGLRAKLTALADSSAPSPRPVESTQTLKQVTILFLDVVGFTRLSQRLDPEAISTVMDDALARGTAIVQHHRGRVLQYAGDNILAVFGADGSREDDAERGVLCGLALLALGKTLGAEVLAAHAHDGFNFRVGMHTGGVLLGGGVDADGSIRGMAVNIAARMEQTAPAGALRISQDTWALVRGVFDAEAQPPITVKGHEAPIATWLVKAAKPRGFRLPSRGIAGVETPLIGRQHELQCFEAALQAVLSDRQPRTLTLLCEAGLGKSRLLREFQHLLSAHPSAWWLLPARAQPSSAMQPYGLLRDLLLRRLEISDSDSAEVARGKLMQGLTPWLSRPNDPAPELLGQLIGLDFSASPALVRLGTDSRLLYDRALTALRLWLERLAASDGSPVVLLLDDLHWADEASLDALAKLLSDVQAPVLALLGARPGLLERRPGWGDALPRHERMTLQSLDAAQSAELTSALLQRLGTVPTALATLVAQQAGGNPFYAEELVMLLIDQGVIDREATRKDSADWTFHAERMLPGRLPTTLTAVLQARIDALDHDARHALQLASVIGPVFWDDALAALDHCSPAALPVLQKKALVQVRPVSTIEHTVEEAFEHHLLHQVSYGTVLKPERRQAHARTAAWLAEHVGDRSDEYLAITAQHHERAGQHALAADCYDRAAAKAMGRSAFKAALQYADHAEEQLALAKEPWPVERTFAAMRLRFKACDNLVLRDRQATELDRMLDAGETHGRLAWVAEALASQTLLSYRLGRLEEAQSRALRGAAVAQVAGEPGFGVLCWGNLAWMASERKDLVTAQQHLDKAVPLAIQARERMVLPSDGTYEVQMLLVQAEVHQLGQKYAARAATIERALALVKGMNVPRLECSCHEFAALAAMDQADWLPAAAHLDATERIAAEFGLGLSIAIAQGVRGRLHLLCGQWDESARASMAAIEKYRAMGYVTVLQRHIACCAEALWRGGRAEEAVALWHEAAAMTGEEDDETEARCARLRLAEAGAASGRADDLAAAVQAVHAELPAMAEIGTLNTSYGLAARMAAWRVLHRGGDAQASKQLALAAAELDRELHD
ncbi:MAG TPA: adenylate/guanylate cyclase domain-containing protein, partial [Rubrivivax sp.]|nr:adenylate/guanylate cyclase domain-containing protein [Rubrivivax sp.]